MRQRRRLARLPVGTAVITEEVWTARGGCGGRSEPEGRCYDRAMAREKVELLGSLGARLAGRLDTPEGAPAGYALFAHCFTCGKDLKSAGVICRELLARGIAVLRFDFTGLGESEGEFADTNFSSNVGDLVAAADFLRRERQAPALLVGHSLGGTAMLAAAARIPEAAAVATIGAPRDTRRLRAKLAARLPLAPNDPSEPKEPNEPNEPNEET